MGIFGEVNGLHMLFKGVFNNEIRFASFERNMYSIVNSKDGTSKISFRNMFFNRFLSFAETSIKFC